MTSTPKYSWAIKQKSAIKVHKKMDKCIRRMNMILYTLQGLKKYTLPITDDFIEAQLNSYLYERFRWGKFCAIWRSIKNIHPLVSKEIYEGYNFERFKSDSEGIFLTKEFYKRSNLK